MLDVCLCFFISLYSESSGNAEPQHVTISLRGGRRCEEARNVDRFASRPLLPAAREGRGGPRTDEEEEKNHRRVVYEAAVMAS